MPAGYSETPLVRKIGLKEGDHLSLFGAPTEWKVEGLPAGVSVSQDGAMPAANVAVAFFRDLAALHNEIPNLIHAIVPDGALWLAWPRRAAGHQSDITDNKVRAAVLPLGLVDVKVAALDNDWSALKMVWRKEIRPTLSQ